jgi:antitoxin component YwqK of YwqJK toxin-antitoxin module
MKMKKSKKNYTEKKYHKNGQYSSIINIKNGLYEGAYQGFDTCGQLIVEGHYKDGKRDRVWKYFFIIKDTPYAYKSFLVKKENYNKDQLDGCVTKYYISPPETIIDSGPVGPVKEIRHYKKGKKEGVWSYFSNIGEIVKKLSFKQNQLNGICEFYEKGFLVGKQSFVNGEREGCTWKYMHNGQLYEMSTFSKNKLNGLREIYHYDGEKEEVYYKNGYKNGNYRRYFLNKYKQNEKQNIRISGRYKNDLQDGLFKIYERDGEKKYLKKSVNYKNDLLHGMEIKYFPLTDQIQESSNYHNGKLSGLRELFCQPDPHHLFSTENYINGKYEGEVCEYLDGSLSSKCDYKNGLRDGEYLRFESGCIVQKGNYCLGERIGYWSDSEGGGVQYKNGKTTIWKNGECQSSYKELIAEEYSPVDLLLYENEVQIQEIYDDYDDYGDIPF